MPVQYEGTLSEHRAVRETCGIFDVSHLGRFDLAGKGSVELLRRLLSNDVTQVDPGRCQYTMLLNERGGVVDDIIVWRLGPDETVVLPNCANHDRVRDRFAADLPAGASIADTRATTVLLAVQGPDAPGLLEDVLGRRPRRFACERADWRGHELVVAGTGYTGEPGGEIIAPAAAGPELWAALTDAGAVPAGLGARDTLRLEMGYPLWGNDLDESTTPLEADLEWVVDWDHDFVGRDALERQRAEGLPKRLVGFAFDDRTIPRHGHPVRTADAAGAVTSGNFSPSLGVGIGLAYLAPPPADGDTIEVDIRGRTVVARRTDPPFLER